MFLSTHRAQSVSEFSFDSFAQQTSKKHNIHAYTGTVTVVEPKKSWFDPQLLSLYAIMVGILGIAVYWAAQNFPGSKSVNKRKDRRAGAKSTATDKGTVIGVKGQPITATTGTTSSYDESWIPEHHLKARQGASSPKPKGRSGSRK